jgi:hypothetical protein
MVHDVKAPEPWDAVREYVPEIEGVIQEQEPYGYFQPARQSDLFEKAPAVSLDPLWV